jgi:hypothetical protein
MSIILIILAAAVAIYLYAAVAFYYGFKNWAPFCGCAGTVCGPRKPAIRQHEVPAGHRTA